jgi:hypothetical protein
MSIEKQREIQASIWAVEGEIHRVKQALKTHPKKFKPERPGATEDPAARQEWSRIKYLLHRELEGLAARHKRLHDAKREVLNSLSRKPVPMTTLEVTIEALVRIEAMFADAPVERIHEELTAFIDKIEADAQRVRDIKGAGDE